MTLFSVAEPEFILPVSFVILCFRSASVWGLFVNTLSFKYPMGKKSGVVRSGELGGRWMPPLLEMTWWPKICGSTAIVSRAAWQLAPSDFFPWGYLKERVFTNNPQTLADPKQNITEETGRMNSGSATLKRVMESAISRARSCVAHNGVTWLSSVRKVVLWPKFVE